MSGTWIKLKKTLSFKSSAAPGSSQNTPDSGSGHQSSSSSTPSLSSRHSRSSNTNSSEITCGICLGNLRSGKGQAIFTAECSHSFHFSCISNNVNYGNYRCPNCRFKWKEIPSQLPTSNADPNRISTGHAQETPLQALNFRLPRPILHVVRYYDDEPLVVSTEPMPPVIDSSNNVCIKSFTEFPAVVAHEHVPNFSVLVNIRAPPLLENARQFDRAPVDLVMVLDISGSMYGSKLVLLKCAARFVIENLGHLDRLSIVSFSDTSSRILPLRRMNDKGREDAKFAISSLSADGRTNIAEGLNTGAKVLEERREKYSVSYIILLSDGRDNYNFDYTHGQFTEFLNRLPVSIRAGEADSDNRTFPVYTFGFGADHDSASMHAISDASGGTFSFIESVEMVQDAFARCIGGLLSVVAQQFRLTISSASNGVIISSISSGRYANEISNHGLESVINIGELYADEEKEFLIHLSVPALSNLEGKKTTLLNVSGSYKNVSKALVLLKNVRVEICRPKILHPRDFKVSLEVDREKNRLSVADTIAEAQKMAENGNLAAARALLADMRSLLLLSASAQAGDELCSGLESELNEISERMVNMELYELTGRAYMLSGLSSHSWQRATTRGDTIVVGKSGSSSHSGVIGYNTPSMVTMVSKSQNLSLLNPTQEKK